MQKLARPSNQNHSQPRKAMFLPQRILKTPIEKLQTLYTQFNLILHAIPISFVYHSNVIRMSLVCHSYITRTSFVCAVCHSYVLVCHSYVTRMSLVCHSYVLVCHPCVTCMCSYVTRMSSVCHSYVLVCHSYVTRMYSYVIRMSLVCGFTMNHIQRQRTGRINLNYLNNW